MELKGEIIEQLTPLTKYLIKRAEEDGLTKKENGTTRGISA